MNDVPHEPSSLQRAALTLHALGEDDRAWLLRSLSMGDRAQLQPLLQELDALGIPRDPRLLEPLAAAGTRESSPPGPRETLADADMGRLAAMLSIEPPRVLNAVLAVSGSGLRERLLSRLTPERRAQVQDCSAAPAPELGRLIAAQIASRLQAEARPAQPASLWRRVGAALLARGGRA